MVRKRVRMAVWLAGMVLSFVFVVLSGLTILFHRDYQSIPSEHLIGNRISSVKGLKENGFPFSFLVIGDTRGSETAETLIKSALQNGMPSFLVILGDFVKEPDVWSHRFFLTEMIQEIKPPFPVFLVPGNHDIDYRGAVKDERRRTTPEIFESLYGPKRFHYVYNDCLFIISEIEPERPTAYLDYLRTALNEEGQGRKHIFVFIHVPPQWLTPGLGIPYPREKEFLSLLKTYKVTTCFFGDYHGYIRAWREGTNFIVSGGGGGRLEGEAFEWGHLHHILKVNVDHDTISENLIVAPERSSLEDIFEYWVFVHLFPLIEGRGWVLYLPFALFLSTGICSLLFFVFPVKRRVKEGKKLASLNQ